MNNYWRSFSKTFTPTFGRMYEKSYSSAEEERQRIDEENRKLQLQQKQSQALVDLLRGGSVNQGIQPVSNTGLTQAGTPQELGAYGDVLQPYSNEEKALRYSLIGNEGQQAYNLYQKLRAPKKAPKYYDVKGDTGINESTGLREKIGGVPLPQAKPIFKYDRENIELEDPITKKRTPLLDASGKPVINEGYKPIPVKEEITGGTYNPKLGKIIAQKVKYDKNGKAVYTEDFAIEPDKAGKEQKDIINEVVERQQNDLVSLGDYIDKELRNNIINNGTPEKPDYVVKVNNQEIPLGERKKQLENEFKQKASNLAEITKSTLTPKARTLIDRKYNEMGKKQLDPMEFQQMTKEAYKSGDITAEDYKKMSGAYFDATYGLFRRR